MQLLLVWHLQHHTRCPCKKDVCGARTLHLLLQQLTRTAQRIRSALQQRWLTEECYLKRR